MSHADTSKKIFFFSKKKKNTFIYLLFITQTVSTEKKKNGKWREQEKPQTTLRFWHRYGNRITKKKRKKEEKNSQNSREKLLYTHPMFGVRGGGRDEVIKGVYNVKGRERAESREREQRTLANLPFFFLNFVYFFLLLVSVGASTPPFFVDNRLRTHSGGK